MYKRNAMGNTRAKLLAGAVLMTLGLTAAGAAMSTNVGGGGATLPAGGYVGWNFTTPGATSTVFSSNVSGKPGASIDSASLFGNWAGTTNAVSYCQTGSGGGKKIFDHSDGTATWGGAGQACTGTASATTGFGADTSIVDPHFVGSDAPMSQAEFNWFGNGTNLGNKATKYGQPAQFPSVVGSVAIVFNNPDEASLNLADAGLCRIFSGQVTDWSQLVSSDFNTLPATFPVPARQLKLAYRSDGSGTTFSLANHLSTVCTGLPSSKFFQTDQAFTTVAAQFTLPAGSIGASGNPGVVAAVSGNTGTIGYAESANLQHTTVSSTTHVANVNGKNPYTDLASSVTLTTILVDNVINGWNTTSGTPGTPNVQALSPAAPVPGCMLMVNPTTYANGINGGYPILAVSNLIFNQKGNGTDVTAVRDLMTYVYSATRRAGATLIGTGTGYAFITAPTANAKINACIAG